MRVESAFITSPNKKHEKSKANEDDEKEREGERQQITTLTVFLPSLPSHTRALAQPISATATEKMPKAP